MKVNGRQGIYTGVRFANGRRKGTGLIIVVVILWNSHVKSVIGHGGSLGRPVTDVLEFRTNFLRAESGRRTVIVAVGRDRFTIGILRTRPSHISTATTALDRTGRLQR